MQTRTNSQNLIYTGHFPFQKFGSQTDRNFKKPVNDQQKYISGPNDITQFNFIISLRTLVPYTGNDAINSYLIRLPTIIDRPTHIQITGNTIGHLDNSTTGLGIKTILLESPLVKQSGYSLKTNENITVNQGDGIIGVIRIPHIDSVQQISTIVTSQVMFKVPIKDQGYATITGIPIRFLDSRGKALSIDENNGDLSPDGELMIQINSKTYNPTLRE